MKQLINLAFLIILSSILSCSISERKKNDDIINSFLKENQIDKREVIFDIKTSFKKGKLVLQGETDRIDILESLLKELKAENVTNEVILLPDSTVSTKKFGLINHSVANMYQGNSFRTELVSQSLLGTPVKLLKKSPGWYLVQTPDKYISWIEEGGIIPLTDDEYNAWKNAERLIFTDDHTTIYSNEYLNETVSDIVCGNILEVLETGYRTYKLKFPDGRTGYALKENWLNFNTFRNYIIQKPDSIIFWAKKFTGRPYHWGGTSALAMDCSGYSKTVYFMNGVILARDASLQVNMGEKVEPDNYFSNFLPGDLLFFGKKAEGELPRKVTHVAISLGKSEYIHASNVIKVNSFDPQSPIYSEARRKSFVEARRILGSSEIKSLLIKNNLWY